jgi:2-desacetyl-2-hydroxyethyl bacteriochlorophyllide A dehydrogenase
MLGTLRLPARKLHRSNRLSAEQLALVETLAVGAHAVRRAALEPEEPILVVGTGPIGLAVIEAARAERALIAALERRRDRIRFCEKTVPGCHLVEPNDPQGKLRQLFQGDLPTAVFDCTGDPGSMMASFDYVAHGGRIIFVGHFPGDVTFHDPVFHGKELTLLASRNSTTADFRRVMERMEKGRLDVMSWITHRVSSHRFVETFPLWLKPEASVFKGMVEWDA